MPSPLYSRVHEPDSWRKTELTLAPTGWQSRARQGSAAKDQLRTTPAELSAGQRSTMDTSDKWFTLDNRGDPIWG